MQALLYQRPHALAVSTVPAPDLQDEHALIRPKYVGICGTDLHVWAGEMKAARVPNTLGHEIVGEVVADASGRLAPGTRVAVEPLLSCGTCRACREGARHVCRALRVMGVHADGGAAELMLAPTHLLHPLPDEIDWRAAACTEPTAVAVHMTRRAGVQMGDVVLVLGGGPIGYLLAFAARAAGAARVIVSEVSADRAARCREAGLEVVAPDAAQPAILEATDGEGADVVFEATGHPAAVLAATAAARVHGTILIGGIAGAPPPVDLPAVIFRELTLIGSRVYESRDVRTAIDLIRRGAVNTESLVTRIVPLADAVSGGFELLRDSRTEMKVLLEP
ncbi:MAG: alcohol dehydrogenase catalytic domain-containing protein [Chloroflexota bacterium]